MLRDEDLLELKGLESCYSAVFASFDPVSASLRDYVETLYKPHVSIRELTPEGWNQPDKMHPSWNASINPEFSAVLAAMQRVNKNIVLGAKLLNPANANFNNLFPDVFGGAHWLNDWIKSSRRSAALKIAGWLPHYTIPFQMLDYDSSAEEISSAIGVYYESNWEKIRTGLQERILKYSIDDESRIVFVEALGAHERGYFRSVPRLLFPEIERMTRATFYGNNIKKSVTSVEKLKNYAGGIISDDTQFDDATGYEFFMRFFKHVYVHVGPNNLDKFKSDPVPNRNAALHGLVSYDSLQSSLNMLFMGDYLFHVLSASRIAFGKIPEQKRRPALTNESA